MGGHHKSQICGLIIEFIRHNDGTKKFNLEILRIPEAPSVELKKRTTAFRLFLRKTRREATVQAQRVSM